MSLTHANVIDACVKLRFHLVALHSRSEMPMSRTWKTDPGLTRDEALAHVESGGNLAVHCAKSDLVVVSADSPAALSAMRSMGHTPAAYTPTGAHFYFKMPAQLKSIPPQHSVVFGNLSEVRVMSGDRLVLIPPSRVIAA